jgi:4-hydroxy-tetrahydrodipicolinate synthase
VKYRKNEAKEYARTALTGVWTALPTNFTDDDRLDEAGTASNLEHCISELKIAGHYCLGNVAEFWAMTNQERMRVHEINVEVAAGRIPLIAGCHHQNPYEVVNLCQHAWTSGIDFAIILTPYVASNSDDAVYDFYAFVADRVDIGIILFNIPQAYYPITEKLAKRLATIPNICGFKQGGPAPAATINLREAVGKELVVSVADETPWLYNAAVMGDSWLLNFCPHLYQVPGYLPIHDYTEAVRNGDMNRAVAISRGVNPSRAVHAKWITGYGRATGRMPVHEQKVWMELLGMVGGPVRTPCAPMTEEARQALRADLEASGLLAKLRSFAQVEPLRQAG